MTLTDIAVLAYFVVLIAVFLWIAAADRHWRRLVVARGLLPDYSPGGIADQAENGGLRDQLRFLMNGITIGRRVKDLADREDPDVETESWRVRGLRRIHVLATVALIGWSIPATAFVLPASARSIPDSGPFRLLYIAVVLAILGSLVIRFMTEAANYGNGREVPLRRVVGWAISIPMTLGVVWALSLLR